MTLPPAECISAFLVEAKRLGIEVRWQRSDMNNLNAAYQARPGTPGVVVLHDSSPRPTQEQLCTLLTHEMVHVLQHWKGDLKATPPLGWPVDGAPIGRRLSPQEAEAYTAQDQPLKVLKAVMVLTTSKSQDP